MQNVTVCTELAQGGMEHTFLPPKKNAVSVRDISYHEGLARGPEVERPAR